MSLRHQGLADILCCPFCKSKMETVLDSLWCRQCAREYPINNGIPIFVNYAAINTTEETKQGAGWLRRLCHKLIPSHTTWTDTTIFDFINQLPAGAFVLNLGSGSGLFDDRIRVAMINLDIILNQRTDVVADAHALPFANNSLDCVFSNAVLEHVQRPWIVTKEIERVVKPDGFVAINLPFLNTIHDEHDYFRFTLKGIRSLFPGFQELHGGVSSGGGSFLPLCIIQHLNLFVPTKFLRTLIYFLWAQVFFRLKFTDKLICHRPEYQVTANSFYFIGKRV